MNTHSTSRSAVSHAPTIIWRVELILLALAVVLGMGVWVWVDRSFVVMTGHAEPREELFQATAQVPSQESRLAMAQTEHQAVQDQLAEARVEFAVQAGMVDALLALHPALETITTTDVLPPLISAERVDDYLGTRVKQEAARRQIEALERRHDELEREVAHATSALQNAQAVAHTQFEGEQARYRLTKPGIMFGMTLAVVAAVAVLMAIVHGFSARLITQPEFRVRGRLMIIGTIGALAVLLGYQSFEIAGAAFMGVLVLLLLLPVLSRLAQPASVERER